MRNSKIYDSKIIIDKYICNKNSTLKDLYLPLIPNNAKIITYYSSSDCDQSIISNIKNTYGNRIRLIPSNPHDFHDRYILWGNKFYVSLGVGLDVFDNVTRKARQESQKILSDGDMPTIPRPAASVSYNRQRRY